MNVVKKISLAGAGTSVIVASALLFGGTAGAAQVSSKAMPIANVAGTAVTVPVGGNGIASVTCPAGSVVTGGGGQTGGTKMFLTDSYRSGNGWTIRATNTDIVSQPLTPVAVCASASSSTTTTIATQ